MASKYGTDQFHGNVSDYYTFVQFAESHDSTNVKMLLDRSPLELKWGYASVRQHSASFVGSYADVSRLKPHDPTVPTQTRLRAFQGLFLTI